MEADNFYCIDNSFYILNLKCRKSIAIIDTSLLNHHRWFNYGTTGGIYPFIMSRNLEKLQEISTLMKEYPIFPEYFEPYISDISEYLELYSDEEIREFYDTIEPEKFYCESFLNPRPRSRDELVLSLDTIIEKFKTDINEPLALNRIRQMLPE